MALLLLVVFLLAPALFSADPRPNLIFILTDDQRADMMGNVTPRVQTPEMDRIVEHGIRFERAYVTTPICMASRASILSGTWERTNRYTGGAPRINDRFMLSSYPTLLRQAGYQVGYVGKWHVAVNDGIIDKMFDSYERLRHPYLRQQPDGSVRHLSDIAGEKAIEFLRSTSRDKPFCLSLSFNAPHAEDWNPDQYIAPPGVIDLYEGLTVPKPPLSGPAFFDSQPAFLKFEAMNRHRWYWRFDNERKRQLLTKRYYAMITGVDRVIGRVRQALDEIGAADNTVIMLMGDNGYFLGDRGWAGKWKPHEVSIRVPLIVHDPQLEASKRGAKPREFALNVDIAPTLLEYAGLEPPAEWQGRSLLPIIRGNVPADWRTDFFHEFLGTHPTIADYEGIRTQRYKYARYIEQDPVYEEVYDLEADPHEEHNLVDKPRYSQLVRRLRKRTDELRDQVGGVWIPWSDDELLTRNRKRR